METFLFFLGAFAGLMLAGGLIVLVGWLCYINLWWLGLIVLALGLATFFTIMEFA